MYIRERRSELKKISEKIIDTHVHIGGEAVGFNMNEDMVEKLLGYYGVDYCIVSNCDNVEGDHRHHLLPPELQVSQTDGLKRTLDLAKRFDGRIGAAPFIKPVTEGLTRDFRKMILDNRDMIKAIKIHPFHSNISPADERCLPYWELAQELDVPVVSHTGGCEAAGSENLAKAAKMFPKVRFVMVHMDLGTDNSLALNMLGECDNLYGDTTWVPVKTTIEAIKRYSSKKMVFGSDAPIDGEDTYVHNRSGRRSLYQEYFYDLPKMIEREDYENIMWKNAAELFKINI